MLHIFWFVYIRPISFYYMSKERHLSHIQCDETLSESRNLRFADERPFWMNVVNCDSLWCYYIHKFEFNKIFIYHELFFIFRDFGLQFNSTLINFSPHEFLKIDSWISSTNIDFDEIQIIVNKLITKKNLKFEYHICKKW